MSAVNIFCLIWLFMFLNSKTGNDEKVFDLEKESWDWCSLFWIEKKILECINYHRITCDHSGYLPSAVKIAQLHLQLCVFVTMKKKKKKTLTNIVNVYSAGYLNVISFLRVRIKNSNITLTVALMLISRKQTKQNKIVAQFAMSWLESTVQTDSMLHHHLTVEVTESTNFPGYKQTSWRTQETTSVPEPPEFVTEIIFLVVRETRGGSASGNN